MVSCRELQKNTEMGYAVYHMEKGKSGSGGIGNHIDRKEGMEHTFKHADETKTHLNIDYPVHENRDKIPMPIAINQRIDEGYNKQRKIRTDAVKFMTHILTGSHEDMKKIFADEKTKNQWIDANKNFIEKEFGAKNIVRFSLHLDETTPHIHAVTVPLLDDGRLSANEIIGNKESMQLRQDRYAEMMKPFELERGLKRTGIKHSDAQDYYAMMNKAQETGKDIEDLTAKRSVLWMDAGIDKEKTIENLKSALITEKTAKKAKDLELMQAKKQLERTKKNANVISENYKYILHSDKAHQQVQSKKIDELQKEMRYAVKRGLDNQFRLYDASPEKKQNLALNPAIDKANEYKVGQELFDKVMEKNDFKKELYSMVQEKVDKSIERQQERGTDRGRGM